MWMEAHMYSVKAKSEAGNIWVRDIMTSARDCKIYIFRLKIQKQRALLGLHVNLWEYTQKVATSSPLKVSATLLNGSRKRAVGA